MSNSTEDRKELLSSVVNTVRAASALAAQDPEFYSNLDKTVHESLQGITSELVELINTLFIAVDGHFTPIENDRESFVDEWNSISNLLDNLFERSDRCLDALLRRRQGGGGVGGSSTAEQLQYLNDQFSGNDDSGALHRVEKPQLKFTKPVDNSESHPFKPLLREKPHALKPLEESLSLIPETDGCPEHYPLPYEFEITNQPYNDSVLQVTPPIEPRPWSETEAIWIDTEERLSELISSLTTKDQNSKITEIAVDLEHHDYRSYYGITCLMQLSTRTQDYLIDTIALRDHLSRLNVVFADPMITKVFHGAYMDIVWLQRDLGLYVVSLFDTYHASRALGLPRHSLAFLLEKYAHFKTEKKYQMADWRVRPLSRAMKAYARADTHFLLYVYDMMRNELVRENKLAGVLNESRNVAKRRFEYAKYRPRFPKTGTGIGSSSDPVYSVSDSMSNSPWRSLMVQYNITPEREPLVRELFKWRDAIARRDDESPRYVMPNQLLVSLVAYAPKDAVGVVNVASSVTEHVRSNAKVIANLISDTMEKIDQFKSIKASEVDSSSHNEPVSVASVQTIRGLNGAFTQLLQRLGASDKLGNGSGPQGKPQSGSASLFWGSDDTKGSQIVTYGTNGESNYVTQTELDARKTLYITQSKALEGVEFEVPVERPVAATFKAEEEEEEGGSAEHVEETNKSDMNEIIVLKKVERGQNKQKKSKQDTEEPTKPYDYTTAERILDERNQQSKTPKNLPSKKRSFDPFNVAVDDSVPKPVTKRRAIGSDKGKNVSFKR